VVRRRIGSPMPITDPYLTDPLDDGRVSYTQVIGSSNVHSVGYKVETHTLFVRFLDKTNGTAWGSIYAYLEVPSTLYLDVLRASSKGQFLNAQIKTTYRHKRIA
jgi:hypothetical protein